VLKNRATGKELFVVVISLLPTEEAKKDKAEEAKSGAGEGGDDDDLD
jgi:hypothetical protein